MERRLEFIPELFYLGVELDLHSASEDEEDGDGEDTESQDEDQAQREMSDADKPVVLKTLACILDPPHTGTIQPTLVYDDDSATGNYFYSVRKRPNNFTESEGEVAMLVPAFPKRKSPSLSQHGPPTKRIKFDVTAYGSILALLCSLFSHATI